MGLILTFTPHALRRDPPVTADLRPAESVTLLALRWWVADVRAGVEPLGRLRLALARAGAPAPAAAALDQFMRFLARGACRQIEVHAPRCPCMAEDECLLLRAAGLAQAGAVPQAAAALAVDTMAPNAAELAAAPLACLGALLESAGLCFPAATPPQRLH